MTWPFPTKPLPNDRVPAKYNPANEEDAPYVTQLRGKHD